MTITIDVIAHILILTNIGSFILGFLWCKSTIKSGCEQEPVSFFKANSQQKVAAPSKIEIDSSKFVTDIKTDSMEKKFDSLGENKVSNENIGSSVNKLKGMKK